ncbi:hypothetical protein ABZ379_38720, partial [Streptomyces canus]|uniref:transposase n=1 Tax=Streptomyces canus TaxID=58343 RepID=UPI003473B756
MLELGILLSQCHQISPRADGEPVVTLVGVCLGLPDPAAQSFRVYAEDDGERGQTTAGASRLVSFRLRRPRPCLIIDLVVGQGELTDAAWERIAPLLPGVDGRGRPWRDHRQV